MLLISKKNIFKLSLSLFLIANHLLIAHKDINKQPQIVTQEKNGFFLSIKKLTPQEAKANFYSINPMNNIRITNRYDVLELIIENHTDKDVFLNPQNIDLPIEDPLTIKRKLKSHTIFIPIFAGLATTALLIAGIGFATLPSIVAGIITGTAVSTTDLQPIPKISHANTRNKLMDTIHPTTIQAYQQIDFFLFINKKNFKKSFSIKLTNEQNKAMIDFFVSI